MASFDPVSAAFDLGGKLLDRFFPDPQKRAEAQLELDKLRETGDLARMTAHFADTASARDRETAVATSANAPYLNKIITPCLAIGVLGSTFALFWFMISSVDGDINPSQKDIIIYVLGVLSAISTQVIAYYFGSSVGSTAKDQTMKRILEKGD